MTQEFADDRLARTLLDRSRRGDADAFAQLYRQQAQAVYALALRLTADRSKAEDVTQETFLKALKGLRGYRGEAPVQVWLRRMAANACIDLMRRDARWVADDDVALPGEVDPMRHAYEAQPPERHAEVQHALGHLARLQPLARTVVWLHTVEGWNHGELSARFGRSESWSKSLLARSLKLLRERALEQPA